MEDRENKDKKRKDISLDFQRLSSGWKGATKKRCFTNGISCRDSEEHQRQFEAWSIISQLMLHGDEGTLLSTLWLQ